MQLIGIVALCVAVVIPLGAARIVLNGIIALIAERRDRNPQAQNL